MAFHPDFQALLPTVLDVLNSDKVKAAYVFGSAVTESFGKDSDLDLLVEIDDSDLDSYVKEWWRILFALEDRTGREIDLLTPNNLVKNKYFREEVLTTRERIV
ncbi:MAG: nucleotidyltransferase family protein [Rectinemataceae bacterium]